jgi:hypothetical protein
MMHWRARRLLWSLPDGTLAERVERALLEHVEGCERCLRELGEIQRAETLVRRLPAALLPLEVSPRALGRLRSLSRWGEGIPEPASERWSAPLLGVAGAFAVAVVVIGMGAWSPILTQDRAGSLGVASVVPDSSYLPRTILH